MRASPYAVAFVLAARFAVGCSKDVDDNEAFREDVVACEEAVGKIQSCCPDVAAPPDACDHLHTVHYSDCGCSDSTQSSDEHWTWPVLSISESRAIATTSCNELSCSDMTAALAREHTKRGGTGCPPGDGY